MNTGHIAGVFNGGMDVYQIALIICIFWVLISGRDAIRSLVMFRVGCLMLACSLILPGLLALIVNNMKIQRESYYFFINAVMGPLLAYLSFPILVFSLVPELNSASQSKVKTPDGNSAPTKEK